MTKVLNEKVLCNNKIAEGIYIMTIKSDFISSNARPGQFVNIKCCEGISALLRRPISICSTNKKEGSFNIVYEVRGTGTKYLSQKDKGEYIDFVGPLGNAFQISNQYKRIAVIGGGIGIFPLLFVLRESECVSKSAFIGFRTKKAIILKNEFEYYSENLFISTDDGSYGHKGVITDLLEEEIERMKYDIIYTCGPLPMMKVTADIASKKGIRCQVSMEERMGCGIGACLVCACMTRKGNDWDYSHVCKDGPVYWSTDVILNGDYNE